MSLHSEHEKVEIPQTLEGIAYKLMLDIFKTEKKFFTDKTIEGSTVLNRKEILNTYKECLAAVRGNISLDDDF
jgi:hypothetical protein